MLFVNLSKLLAQTNLHYGVVRMEECSFNCCAAAGNNVNSHRTEVGIQMLFGFVCIACAFEKRELAETQILKTVFLHFIPSFLPFCLWLVGFQFIWLDGKKLRNEDHQQWDWELKLKLR